jgi:hypothetical protein
MRWSQGGMLAIVMALSAAAPFWVQGADLGSERAVAGPGPFPSLCNLSACDSSLTLQVLGAVPTPFPDRGTLRVEIHYEAERRSCVLRFGGWARPWCQTPDRGEGPMTAVALDDGTVRVQLLDGSPSVVDLALVDGEGRARTYRIVPGYVVRQPNGLDCAPICATARVRFEH